MKNRERLLRAKEYYLHFEPTSFMIYGKKGHDMRLGINPLLGHVRTRI
jgi:hypothetical protein